MSKNFSTPEDYYDHGMREYPAPARVLYTVVLAILYAFSKLMWRWSIRDAQKLVPDPDKGSVIICNHTSMAEVIAIVSHLWHVGRRVRPIFKSEFNSTGAVKWAFSRAGGIPVERGTADMKSLRRAQHALQRGEDILIFPEGTRIRTDDEKVELHGGFALIANMGKAPIVPMAVCGFRDLTPKGSKLTRPLTCWMAVGDSVSFDDAPSELKRREKSEWVEKRSIERMYALRDALQAEHPGRK